MTGQRGQGPGEPEGDAQQFGAIPYRFVDDEIVFLLITSRHSGKWIFPKGSPIEGLTPAESAAQEAYEEAGVRGRTGTVPVGRYHATGGRSGGRAPMVVEMYPLEVEDQLGKWPEKGQRKRHWVLLDEARSLLSDPALAALAEKIANDASG